MSDSPKHYMDQKQILHSVFDFDKEAIRTIPHEDIQHEIAISAESDSIMSYAPSDEVAAGEIKDCASYKKAGLYLISGSVDIQVSPQSSGDKFYSIAKGSIDSIDPKAMIEIYDICAKRIKLIADGEAYLVLQG